MSHNDLECTIEEAKSICRTLTRHISNLCVASDKLMTPADDNKRNLTLRPAYVLTLLALEETGKMFKIWQVAADMERDNPSGKVQVEDLFRNHKLKGGLAGDLCCQMLDYAVGALDNLQRYKQQEDSDYESIESLKTDFSKAAAHLKEVYVSFKTEREIAMYVSADNDAQWNQRIQIVSEVIGSEEAFLWFVANMADSYLKTEGSFNLAINALSDIRNGVASDNAYAFFGRLLLGFGAED